MTHNYPNVRVPNVPVFLIGKFFMALLGSCLLCLQGLSAQTPAGLQRSSGQAYYSASISGSTSCSNNSFTLILTNISGGGENMPAIGSVRVRLPAGITHTQIAHLTVNNGWTILPATTPDEIRLKAHDNLSNAIPGARGSKPAGQLLISLSVNVPAAQHLTWKTDVYSGSSWSHSGDGLNTGFQLAALTPNGGISPTTIYPSYTVYPAPAASLGGSAAICAGESVRLPIRLSGKAPWILSYKAGEERKVLEIAAADVKDEVYLLQVNPEVSTTYELLGVSDAGGCSSKLAGTATVIINQPPRITRQLADTLVACEKEILTFSVAAEGTGLTYQWRRNGVTISGAQADTFTIPAASEKDTRGTYDVVVSGACGKVISSATLLIVQKQTIIQVQPLPKKELCEYSPVAYEVKALGTGLSYQWYKDIVDEEHLIEGATQPLLSFSNIAVADAGTYYVQVSGACGTQVSKGGELIVNTRPLFGEWIFRIKGQATHQPVLEVNTSLTIEIPVGGKDPENMYFSLVGHGKGLTIPATLSGGLLVATHRFLPDQAGVYLLTANASNECGSSKKSYGYVVVADPSGGYLTGNGWIQSQIDTRYPFMTSAGKLTYRFSARYTPGTSDVTGQAAFTFQAGNMIFQSSSMDHMRLVVSGNTASFKGKGTINGEGTYGFMLAVLDNGSDGDKIRLMVWEYEADGNQGKMVYDSQARKSDGEEALAATLTGGGSIAVHKAVPAKANTQMATAPASNHFQVSGEEQYTNPVEDKLSVDLSKLPAGDITVTILDAEGEKVYEKSFSSQVLIPKVEIDLSGVESGIYVLQTRQGTELTTTKVFKF